MFFHVFQSFADRFSHRVFLCFPGQEAVEPAMFQNYSHVAMTSHTPYAASYSSMGSAAALPAPSYGHFQSSGSEGARATTLPEKPAVVEVRCNQVHHDNVRNFLGQELSNISKV